MKRVLVPLLLSLLVATPAAAESKRILLCFPGGPGSTADAQPVVDRFLGKIAGLAGWDSATGAYYNDMSACAAEMKKGAADVVIVPLDIYLKERAAWKLAPIATLENKETSGQYHLIAKEGATLASLKGKKLVTGLKCDEAFLGKVAFAGKLSTSDYAFERERSPLRAIKNVAKGQADAAILDDNQKRALEGKPMGEGIVVVVSGPELPGAIVAGAGTVPSGLSDALAKVCQDSADLCNEMRIKGFGKVDAGRLAELEQQLSK